MIDYWNDPPETPEAPQCCGDEMTVMEDGACVCDKCKRIVAPFPDPEPDHARHEAEVEQVIDQEQLCPHGRAGECGECDHAGDIAFDAAREARMSR